jgi:hypothetical protein
MIVLTEETKKKFYSQSVNTLKKTSLLDQLIVRFGIDQSTVSEIANKTIAYCFKENFLLEKGDIIELDFYNSDDDFVPEDICLKNTGFAKAKITEMCIDPNQLKIEISYELEVIMLTVTE